MSQDIAAGPRLGVPKADGAYPQILSAYQAVEQWIRTRQRPR
jgi:hypothetical protein